MESEHYRLNIDGQQAMYSKAIQVLDGNTVLVLTMQIYTYIYMCFTIFVCVYLYQCQLL